MQWGPGTFSSRFSTSLVMGHWWSSSLAAVHEAGFPNLPTLWPLLHSFPCWHLIHYLSLMREPQISAFGPFHPIYIHSQDSSAVIVIFMLRLTTLKSALQLRSKDVSETSRLWYKIELLFKSIMRYNVYSLWLVAGGTFLPRRRGASGAFSSKLEEFNWVLTQRRLMRSWSEGRSEIERPCE